MDDKDAGSAPLHEDAAEKRPGLTAVSLHEDAAETPHALRGGWPAAGVAAPLHREASARGVFELLRLPLARLAAQPSVTPYEATELAALVQVLLDGVIALEAQHARQMKALEARAETLEGVIGDLAEALASMAGYMDGEQARGTIREMKRRREVVQ